MLLYYYDADESGAWDHPDEWFTDEGATSNYGNLPGNGDSCALADGQIGGPTNYGTAIDLGDGVCSFDLSNYGGTIVSGTFTGNVWNSSLITGGVFTGYVQQGGGTTSGGLFTDGFYNMGTVSGGAFQMRPGSAWFLGFCENNGTVTGGMFTGSFSVMAGSLNGAFWLQSGTVNVDGYAMTGTGDPIPSGLTGFGGIVSAIPGVYPSAAYVHADAGEYGPNGDDFTPLLSALADWALRSSLTPDESRSTQLSGEGSEMFIYRNRPNQGVYLTEQTGTGPLTGDAANITATVSLDGGAPTVTQTVHPTEIGGGVYWLPLARSETLARLGMAVIASSSTSGATIAPVFPTMLPVITASAGGI
jgi:hypothetical protein